MISNITYLNKESERKLADQFLTLIESKKIATIADLKSKSRKRHLAYIRHAYCKILYETTRLPAAQIGLMVNRDHATVVHACKQDSDKFMRVYTELLTLFIYLKK